MDRPAITEIHIVREGGIPIIVYPSNDVKNELVSMFCSAINSFGNEKFKSNIQSIRFNTGASIFFKEFRIHDELMQIFILTSSFNKDTTSFCDQLAIKIKWIVEKHKLYSRNGLTPNTIQQISEELLALIASQAIAPPQHH